MHNVCGGLVCMMRVGLVCLMCVGDLYAWCVWWTCMHDVGRTCMHDACASKMCSPFKIALFYKCMLSLVALYVFFIFFHVF